MTTDNLRLEIKMFLDIVLTGLESNSLEINKFSIEILTKIVKKAKIVQLKPKTLFSTFQNENESKNESTNMPIIKVL